MSYQVLARKYRPGNFQELAGQEHVLRALVNALENNRLHHAYLFTGTRGIGKTTIARILAKCLNCEEGISAIPCGLCSTCTEIAQGRSVDVIEVDAASRTRVEDTRELLDNVQYMPTRNRFKIYLIDEVHMLSNHSFNALLKTLEEPPEHVKFLLATTDPRKLPVTVLSRCLQFNLKTLSPERIVSYLQQVLKAEELPFEEPALWQLSRAADGSMRDALSLTDQAISFGNNSVNEADVRTMLGSIDQRAIYELINCLIEKDAPLMLEKIAGLAEFAPDYSLLLADFLAIMHRVAVAQAVNAAIDNSQGDQELVQAVAEAISRQDVQLFYQIGLIGQRDLPFSPDARVGFEMIMLRMLAFNPVSADEPIFDDASAKKKMSPAKPESKVADILASLGVVAAPQARLADDMPAQSGAESKKEPEQEPEQEPEPAEKPDMVTAKGSSRVLSQSGSGRQREAPGQLPGDRRTMPSGIESDQQKIAQHKDLPPSDKQATEKSVLHEDLPELNTTHWAAVLPRLALTGVTLSLASNCSVQSYADSLCHLVLSEHHASLWNSTHEARIESALSELYGTTIKVTVLVGPPSTETPAEIEIRIRQQATDKAIKIIENDKNVQRLVKSFDGKLDRESISARSETGE